MKAKSLWHKTAKVFDRISKLSYDVGEYGDSLPIDCKQKKKIYEINDRLTSILDQLDRALEQGSK